MKYNLFFVFYLFVIFTVSSQLVSDTYRTAINDGDMSNNGIWLPGKSINSHIEGSTYLFSNWVGSYKVISKNGITASLFNLNYNLNSKKLEAFVSKDSVFQYDLSQFDYVILQDKKFKVLNEDLLDGLFYEVFNGNRIKLFKEATVFVEYGVLNPLTQTKMQEDKYVKMYSYYFFVNGKYEKAKLNKNSIVKYTKDKSALVKEFASKNKLKYDFDDDVSKILKYYDSLD